MFTVRVEQLDLFEKSAVLLTDDYINVSSNAEPNSVRFVCDVELKPTLGVLEVSCHLKCVITFGS